MFANVIEWYSKLPPIKALFTFVVALAVAANAVSFALVRIIWFVDGGPESPINEIRPVTDQDGHRTLVIEIGGAMGVAKCFNVFREFYQDSWGVIYLDHGKNGYSLRAQLAQIDQYIEDHDITDIRVVGISVGDYYCRVLEDRYDNVQTLAVNPEPSHKFLRFWSKWASRGGGFVAEVVSIPFGWLSTIDLIPKTGERFSLAYTADQFMALSFVNDAPHTYDKTVAVILGAGNLDQFLKNEVAEKYFKGATIKYVNSDHGNTVDKADEYRKVLQEIFPSGVWE